MEKNSPIADKYDVTSVPTFLFFKNKAGDMPVGTFLGFLAAVNRSIFSVLCENGLLLPSSVRGIDT